MYSAVLQIAGIIAAEDDAPRFDLLGMIAWDLMHINKSAFNLLPNGGGISGCVDPHSMFNPMCHAEKKTADVGLEEALEKTVATQYLEVSPEIAAARGVTHGRMSPPVAAHAIRLVFCGGCSLRRARVGCTPPNYFVICPCA